LWRAVDQHSNVLDVLVQSRRNAKAAKRFFRKLLKGHRYVPRVVVTDKLASYQLGPPRAVGLGDPPAVEVSQSSRELPSADPTTRARDAGFKSVGGAQRFLAAFSEISPYFRPRRHRLPAPLYRQVMTERFAVWRQITVLTAA
jgi:putative transposase